MQDMVLTALVATALGCGAAADGGETTASETGSPTREQRASGPATAEADAGAPAEAQSESGSAAAEAKEAAAKAESCRKEMERLQEKPTHEQSAEDYAEVADCFERAELPGMQLRLLSEIARRFPESEEVKAALRTSGEVYEEIGLLDRAAEAYERYARRYGREEDARALLQRAICLQYVLGRPSAERNARELSRLNRAGSEEAHKEPEELCPNALELVTEAICRLHQHDRSETDQMAASLAERRSEGFAQAYVPPEELCSGR